MAMNRHPWRLQYDPTGLCQFSDLCREIETIGDVADGRREPLNDAERR
jgi:hypothetical protein